MTDRSKQDPTGFPLALRTTLPLAGAGEQELAQAGHHQRIAEAGEYQGDRGGTESNEEMSFMTGSSNAAECCRIMSTSLMPINGATIPPSP